MNLTEQERRVLAVIVTAHLSGTRWVDGPRVARVTGQSPQGAHQTAASLARKGALEKIRRERAGRSPRVLYRVTPAGLTESNRVAAGSGGNVR